MLGVGVGALDGGSSFGIRDKRWWTDGASFDADFLSGRFVVADVEQPTEAAWLTALGGIKTGSAKIFGPALSADATELVSNGDFSGGTTGWAGSLSGTIAVVGGECILTGNAGNSPAVSQAVSVQAGRAYRLRAGLRRGSLSPSLSMSNVSTLGGAQNFATQLVTTTTASTAEVNFSSFSSSAYVGCRVIYNPANGDAGIDNVSVREVVPYAAFLPGSLAGIIDAVTPAAAGGNKVLWQADDNATSGVVPLERNFLRLVWDADSHLRFIVSYQTAAGTTAEQANFDLGIVGGATAFRVCFSAAANAFRAALAGRPEKSVGSGSFPGVAVMRIGQGQAGNVWDGTIHRVTIFPSARNAAQFQSLAAGDHSIVAWGDSLTAGTGATVEATRYPQVAQTLFAIPRGISNQGIGGQTSTQIAARLGGVDTRLSVSANQIPASGPVTVTDRSAAPLTSQGIQSLTGKLAGVAGTLQRNGDDSYVFVRSSAGDAAACPALSPFIGDLDHALRNRTAWLWVGRNNFSDAAAVKADLAAMIGHLGHQRFLIGSILNGNYTNEYKGQSAYVAITTLNADLAALYGPRFVDLRGALISAGNPTTDATDIARDIVPASLRSDNIHLTDAGYAIVASSWAAATMAMGW